MTTLGLGPAVAKSLVVGCIEAGVRLPTTFSAMNPADTLSWEPDLTPAEQTTVDLLVQLATGASILTPTDWAAITPRLDALRVFRQQSQSEFMAKTANVRDRELFDAMNDVSAILLRVLRTT